MAIVSSVYKEWVKPIASYEFGSLLRVGGMVAFSYGTYKASKYIGPFIDDYYSGQSKSSTLVQAKETLLGLGLSYGLNMSMNAIRRIPNTFNYFMAPIAAIATGAAYTFWPAFSDYTMALYNKVGPSTHQQIFTSQGAASGLVFTGAFGAYTVAKIVERIVRPLPD